MSRIAAVVLSAASCAALLTACDRGRVHLRKSIEDDTGPMRAVAQLQCPEHQGPLTRVRTSPDGLSCDYAGPKGADVRLQLIRLAAAQKPEDALMPLERQLNALMPGVQARITAGEASSAAAEGRADSAAQGDGANAGAGRAGARGQTTDAHSDRGRRGDDVSVDMPGVHVDTRGDSARVNLPGIHVDADDDSARVNIAGIHIDSRGKGDTGSAHVHVNSGAEEVTIRAENQAAEIRSRREGAGVRASYILKDDSVPDTAWRMVGYEAWGPATGPVVAAVVRSHDRHEDRLFRAARELVRQNVGG